MNKIVTAQNDLSLRVGFLDQEHMILISDVRVLSAKGVNG